MTGYLEQIDASAPEARWRLARRFLFDEPLPFFAELRAERPVLVLPEVTLVSRHQDCSEILLQHDLFGVDLYAPKQGDYFMAQDDTPQHWREKSIMKTVLDREDAPRIRDWVADETARRIAAAPARFDAVAELTRGVPIALVQRWFGFENSDPDALFRWSYWNQMDAFWNQHFDSVAVEDQAATVTARKAASVAMAAYLVFLVGKKAAQLHLGGDDADVVTRLLRLKNADALEFDLPRLIQNVGGLLIGAVETTSHTAVNALSYLDDHPELMAEAKAAAGDGAEAFDGFVFEALRFKPAFPYFFRVARRATALARGSAHETAVPEGATVLAVTHSAMFDESVFEAPAEFRPDRPRGATFTFGRGIHECLGRAIAGVMTPEIVRQALLADGLRFGTVDRRGGPVPEVWEWTKT